MDPEIDFVTLLGTAGTGKTLLALAAGLTQTMDDKLYHEIVMTRETVPVGEDIGFLPGTEEEKMAPWMGALIDNLELLGKQEEDTDWEKDVTKNILMNKIKIRSLNFMRGRTFLNRYLIIDEAQNLTPRGVAIFAKACFGHPSPSKRQKLNATANAFGAPDVLRTCHFATTIVNSVLAS